MANFPSAHGLAKALVKTIQERYDMSHTLVSHLIKIYITDDSSYIVIANPNASAVTEPTTPSALFSPNIFF